MPPTWASQSKDQTTPTQTHAQQDTKSDVDSIILDYLICLAIDSVFEAIKKQIQNEGRLTEVDDAKWQVDTVKGFKSSLKSSELEPPLAPDLDIKFQILLVAEELLHVSALEQNHSSGRPPLSPTGVMFLRLCSVVSHKIPETELFYVVARLIMQVIIEDQRDGRQPSRDLTEICSWSPREPAQESKWDTVREQCFEELNQRDSTHSLVEQYPLLEFVMVIALFLRNLMTTLEPPVLIQLERGKLGDLSREDTQDLKNLVGLR